jgi:CRP-like cAMP-binding protein
MLHVKDRDEDSLDQIQKWSSQMKGMRKFPPEVQKLLIKAGRFEKWGIGRTILREGHPAHCFYILLDGEMEVTIVDKAAVEAASLGIRRTFLAKGALTIADLELEEKKCRENAMERAYVRHLAGISALLLDAVINSGDTFGEIAFRTNGIRISTVRTTRTCEMLMIRKEQYLEIMHSDVRLSR